MKGKKIIVPILATAIGVSAFAGTAINTNYGIVSADTDETTYGESIGTELSVKGFSSVGHIGADEAYKLPSVTAVSGSVVTMTLTGPTGKTVLSKSYTVGNSDADEVYFSGNQEFTFEMSGDYILKYTAKTTSGYTTTSEDMVITVSSSTYGLALSTNSVNAIPSTIKTGAKIRVPVPTVTIAGEEKEMYSVSNGEVSAIGVTNTLKVSVTDSLSTNDDSIYIADGALPKYDSDSEEYYYEFDCNQNGKYVVTYDLYEGSTIKKTITKEFTAKSDYDIDNMTLSFTAPTKLKASTVTYNEETSIPTVTVKDGNGNTVNAYVKIEVLHTKDNDGNADTTAKWETVGDDFLYTFSQVGNYLIRYTAIANNLKNTSGNALKSSAWEYTLENLKDIAKPTIYVTNDFTVNSETNAVTVGSTTETTKDNILAILGDKSSSIPSTAVLAVDGEKLTAEVSLPAFYATDNGSTYSNMATLVREYYDSNGATTTITSDKADANSATTVKFHSAGTYTIVYRAIDQNNNKTEKEFKIEVIGSENASTVTSSATNLTFDLVDNYKTKTDKITFNAPTASNAYDNNVDVKVVMTLYSSSGSEVKTIDLTTPYKDGDEYVSYLSDGKYTINLEDIEKLSETKYINITATATPDTGAESKSLTRKITIIGGDDNTAPTIESTSFMTDLYALSKNDGKYTTDQDGNNVFTKGARITLPSMTFSDDQINDLGVDIVVRHIGNDSVTATGLKTVYMTNAVDMSSSTTQIISGRYFYANEVGDYEITYIAKDNGVNSVSKTYRISVKGKDSYSVSVSDASSNDTVSVNTRYAVVTPTLTVNNVVQDFNAVGTPYTWTWELYLNPEYMDSLEAYQTYMNDNTLTDDDLQKAKDAWQEENPMTAVTQNGTQGFTAKSAGTVGILYRIMNNGTQVGSYVKYITISAGDTPSMALFINGDANEYGVTEDSKIMYDYTSGDTIEIPEVGFKNAGAYNTELRDNLVVTFSNTKGTHKGTLDKGTYSLVGQADTIYTFTYTTSYTGGSTMTCTYTVYCGDYQGPVLDTSSVTENEVFKTTVTVGGQFTLNTADLVKYISDDTSAKEDVTITAKLVNSSNVTQSMGSEKDDDDYYQYSCTLSATGTYTLTITLKDEVGNTTTETFSITCEDEVTETSNVGTIVGTVLIVLALVLLAGVVTYFVVTSVKKKGRTTPKDKKKTTK